MFILFILQCSKQLPNLQKRAETSILRIVFKGVVFPGHAILDDCYCWLLINLEIIYQETDICRLHTNKTNIFFIADVMTRIILSNFN